MASQILIVDDDPVQRRLLEAHVQRMGHRALLAEDGGVALDILSGKAGRTVALVTLDLAMPGTGGLEVLAEMRRRGLEIPVIVQTAKGGVEAVVAAMRAGAFDFVVKPASPEKLKTAITEALRVAAAGRRRSAGHGEDPAGSLDRAMSAAMEPVLRDARRAASSTIPILIEGETGVGKEWLARAIRAAGSRAAAPFVAVNCGALPEALVESILFGHEKGAFTGATERRAGRFLEADGGTLFLDEVGELPPEAQVKLLRVLQSGEVEAVGGRAPVRADVRLVSATNRDLAQDVASGRFREDLFYRLNVLPLRVPPLRDRREEIPFLCDLLLRRFSALENLEPVRRLSSDALGLLSRHDWPGNVRQLENAVHRAIVLADGTVLGPSNFLPIAALGELKGLDEAPPSPILPPPAAADELEELQDQSLAAFDEAGHLRTLDAVEADLIRLAFRRYEGRMTEIARRLGIGRSTLYRKIRQFGIDAPSAGPGEADEPDAPQHSLGSSQTD